jgi:branched-chain amino acid transport system substrate-binding protein
LGPGLPLIGVGTTSDESILSQLKNDEDLNMVTAFQYAGSLNNPANNKFRQAYKAKFKEEASLYAECGYTSGLCIKKALESVQGNDPDKKKLIAALRTVSLDDAPRGSVRMDDRGQLIADIYIRKVQKVNGKSQNVVVQTYPKVSQFWKWTPAEYLAQPEYSRNYPPCKYCDGN